MSGVTDPWSIFLMDTPGFGTADKGISQLSKTAMETSQAYVYTMSFKEFDDGSHSQSFQLMKQKDEGIYKSKLHPKMLTNLEFSIADLA